MSVLEAAVSQALGIFMALAHVFLAVPFEAEDEPQPRSLSYAEGLSVFRQLHLKSVVKGENPARQLYRNAEKAAF